MLGITIGFAAAVQPGPTQIFIISRTLTGGWRYALPLACTYLISDIPIVSLVLLILSNIPDLARDILHLAGGVFLLYLAWGAYKAFKEYNRNENIQTQSRVQSLFKAVTINLLNPNPYLTWSLVMGPMLIKAWQENPVHGISLVTGFYGTLVLTTAAIIIIFGVVRRLGPVVIRVLVGVSAVALAGFGIYQIVLGVQNLTGR
ncbi:MAG: LysE family transporter [Dehalococcoidales bacterium]|nr:MAG: LysE family transporter [Dehalococcoidales bacterium]